MRQRYTALNPAELKRAIDRLTKKLTRHTVRLRNNLEAISKPSQDHPWRSSAEEDKRKTKQY